MKPILIDNINGTYDINHLHKLLGHCGQEILNDTVKMYAFKSSGNFEKCEQCAIAKSWQKNVKKNWLDSSDVPGERLYINISSIKERYFGGAKFWALIVDDCTDYCWSFVLKNKSDLKGKIKILLTDLKIADQNVRFIRCDNAGKNMTMKNDPEIKSFGVKFEFSGLRSPQRNRKVERKFQRLYGRTWSMLNGADLESELRDEIWAECVMNITYWVNIISTKSNLKAHLSCYMVKGQHYAIILKYLAKMEW
jgi:hypothetical protein